MAGYKPPLEIRESYLRNFCSTKWECFRGGREWKSGTHESVTLIKTVRISSCAKRLHLLTHFVTETNKDNRYTGNYFSPLLCITEYSAVMGDFKG